MSCEDDDAGDDYGVDSGDSGVGGTPISRSGWRGEGAGEMDLDDFTTCQLTVDCRQGEGASMHGGWWTL